MKNNKIVAFVLILTMLVTLAACGNTTDISDSESSLSAIDSTNSSGKSNDESSIDITDDTMIDISGVKLSHTYTTRFGEVNQITCPAFSFDYPNGWTITSENVTPTSEEVVLTNETGTTITYWNFGGMRELTGPTRGINCVDVTRVADANFIPGYVQATDYSDLGTFMVAKLKITGEYDVNKGGEYADVENGRVRYALLPESQAGEHEECLKAGLPTFSFWYAGHISLIANASSGEFSEQEEREVVAILSSFRDDAVSSGTTDIPSKPTDANTVTTIDELWTMLEGTWIFEEYQHMGKTHTNPNYEHTMELQYVDNQPCMSKYTQVENIYYRDEIFYDFAAVDEFRYNAYTYKRDSYGGEYGNWSDDAQLAWYVFDLSNLSNGELTVEYHVSWDSGFVDDNTYKYRHSKALINFYENTVITRIGAYLYET